MVRNNRTEVLETVRYLRKNQTQAEKYFWLKVKKRQINGKKILRQFAFIFDYEDKKRFFVADFYCAEKKLIIEIDGEIHDYQKEKDKYREYLLSKLGLKIIRFNNKKVLNSIDSVLEELMKYL